MSRGQREAILNQPVPVNGRSFRYAAWAVVLLVLVQLCWLQREPVSELRQVWVILTRFKASREAMMPYVQLDRIVNQANSGNVLLKLNGYARTNRAVENSLSFVYFRASYALYPRRVYAAPSDKVINNGRDIMQAGFDPAPEWLQAHDVYSELIFGSDKAGGETLRMEILPPQNGPAGASAGKSGDNK